MKYVLLTLISLAGALPAAAKLAADLGPAEWYGPPRLPVLMGFVKDPQHHRFKVLTAHEESALTGAALHIHLDSAETVIWAHERPIMPDGHPLETRREGEWLVMELFPDPELTIVLE